MMADELQCGCGWARCGSGCVASGDLSLDTAPTAPGTDCQTSDHPHSSCREGTRHAALGSASRCMDLGHCGTRALRLHSP